jgi:hypothetical protein
VKKKVFRLELNRVEAIEKAKRGQERKGEYQKTDQTDQLADEITWTKNSIK